ncbi:pyridoxal kinase [Caerostris darwini]|uniref:Pyridoxal kinase n=1 Tax=Caerostris darwini TaxID=1538125 RepID=A0AAV4S3A2_9ARAC|nr:pyridoxal kinase [Caerostris darwini]
MENHVMEKNFRVLSVQSHVVSGYVGNKSAVFPLQLHGFEVDYINSVQLSNHTGYKEIKGQILKSEELQELYDGLKANDLLTYTHVLTGYVGNVTFLTKLAEIIQDLKKTNPSLYIVCDPVMGDNGIMYVPSEVLPIYRDILIPLSDLITPNQFEAELLTGIKIKSRADIMEVMKTFHQNGVKTVVLSGVQLETSEKLYLFGSSILEGHSRNLACMEIEKLPAEFTGTGDLFSALLLAWMAKTDGDLKASCEKVVNSLQCVLRRTIDFASKKGKNVATMELQLVQSKLDIENPSIDLKCLDL